VISSFLLSFPGVEWPPFFRKLGNCFGGLNIDFVTIDFLNTPLKCGVNYCNSTMAIAITYLFFLLAIPFFTVAFRYRPYGIPWRKWGHYYGTRKSIGQLSARRQEMITDKGCYLAVLCSFVAYPILSMRLLNLFSAREFGVHRVIDADWRLETKDIGVCQAGGAVFIALYTAGIPIAFFYILYHSARPLANGDAVDITRADAAEKLDFEQRQLSRFGILYAKYEPQCWWWELVELSRKLVLTGAIMFMSPGFVTQIWFAILLSTVFLLGMAKYTPFLNARVDFIAFTAQLCTVLTLIISLGIDSTPTVVDEGFISQGAMSVLLTIFAIVPLVLGIGLFAWAGYDAFVDLRRRRPPRERLSAAMRDDAPAGTDEAKPKGRHKSSRAVVNPAADGDKGEGSLRARFRLSSLRRQRTVEWV